MPDNAVDPELSKTEEQEAAPSGAKKGGRPCPKCGGTEIVGPSYERGEAGILEKGSVQRERLVYSCAGCGATLRKEPTLDAVDQKPSGFSEGRRRARNKKKR